MSDGNTSALRSGKLTKRLAQRAMIGVPVPTGRFRTARERAGMVEPPRIDPDPRIRPHLVAPLFSLCAEAGIRGASPEVNRLNDRGVRMCVAVGITGSRVTELEQQVEAEPDLLIDLVDWLIRERFGAAARRSYEYDASRVAIWLSSIERFLDTGGSAWTVDRDRPGLSLRVSNEEREAYAAATSVDDPVTAYLSEAWSAAWGVCRMVIWPIRRLWMPSRRLLGLRFARRTTGRAWATSRVTWARSRRSGPLVSLMLGHSLTTGDGRMLACLC